MKFRSTFVIMLTLGILWGCSSMDPLIREARGYIESEDYMSAIELTEQALAENPSDPFAHYYRGTAYGSLAEATEPVSDRKDYYREARSSILESLQLFEQQEIISTEFIQGPDVINIMWATEHNSGVEILSSDSLRQTLQQPFLTAIAHFENAIIIQPDSSFSYIALASAHYQNEQIPEAITSYEQAMVRLSNPQVSDYDFLINLYLMEERNQEALELANEAVEVYPSETALIQYQADAYYRTGQPERAIELVRELVESDPQNAQHRYVLGTQIYQAAQEILDESLVLFEQAWSLDAQLAQLSQAEQAAAQEDIDQLIAEAEELQAEGDAMADEAIEVMERVIELRPDDDRAYNVLGVIYQNRAATFFDKRNEEIDDNQLANELDAQGRESLEIALENYETAAELNPDEPSYWDVLFRVYTTLDMPEQADEALERFEELQQ